MEVLFWMIGIHIVMYTIMLLVAYLLSKDAQRKGERTSVTIRHILNFWPGVCFIPFFGPICLIFIIIVIGLENLKDWIITTKFWVWIQNILNKEI